MTKQSYSDARPLIESGDILAFGHEGFASRSDLESQVVRFFTRSEFSHVGLAWVVAGRVMILEAVVPMVRIYPLSRMGSFYWLPLRQPLSAEAEEKALSIVGQEYSKWEAIKSFFGRNRANQKWQCAEFVQTVLGVNGIKLDGNPTPTTMVRAAMELGAPLVMVRQSREDGTGML